MSSFLLILIAVVGFAASLATDYQRVNGPNGEVWFFDEDAPRHAVDCFIRRQQNGNNQRCFDDNWGTVSGRKFKADPEMLGVSFGFLGAALTVFCIGYAFRYIFTGIKDPFHHTRKLIKRFRDE